MSDATRCSGPKGQPERRTKSVQFYSLSQWLWTIPIRSRRRTSTPSVEGFAQAFQQTTSKLRSYVEIERQSSEFDYYDRIGIADDLNLVTNRYGDNPMSEMTHERRRIGLADYDQGKAIDEKDLIRVATDPTHAYMQGLVASANRKVDDLIITGLTAPVYTGKAGATTVNFVSTTADKVTVGAVSDVQTRIVAGTYLAREAATEGIDVSATYTGTAGASTGLTLVKLKAVRTTMLKLDAIDQEEVLNCFISAEQFEDLLGINEVINSDYAVRKSLSEGNVTTFMGFRFIHCERLPLSGGIRSCFVFKPRAIKLAIGQDIVGDIWRLPAKKNIPYIYTKLGMGTSRMWGENLARVRCAE